MSSRAEEKAKAKEARLAAERAADQAAARKKRLVTLGGILAAAAVIVLAAVLISQGGTEETPPPDERLALFDGIPQSGTKLGADTAPVVVEEFADLQCPFCAQAAESTIPPIVTDFVKPGDVQLDLKLMSFLGEDSVRGAQVAAGAAEQNRLWQFAEAFFAAQGQENSGYVTDDFLRDVAGKAGIDADKALEFAGTGEANEFVAAGMTAADEAKVESTPTFRVGKRGGEMKTVTAEELPGAISDLLGEQSGT